MVGIYYDKLMQVACKQKGPFVWKGKRNEMEALTSITTLVYRL